VKGFCCFASGYPCCLVTSDFRDELRIFRCGGDAWLVDDTSELAFAMLAWNHEFGEVLLIFPLAFTTAFWALRWCEIRNHAAYDVTTLWLSARERRLST
jgi:hypothetical protein